jgi:predicted trehalose synthase
VLWSLQNTVTRALAARPSTSPTDHERLAAWSRWWVAGAAHALLAAYREATAGTGLVPNDTDGLVAVLRLLLFDRAFSDISRTAVASPEWLETSAAAALALIQ